MEVVVASVASPMFSSVDLFLHENGVYVSRLGSAGSAGAASRDSHISHMSAPLLPALARSLYGFFWGSLCFLPELLAYGMPEISMLFSWLAANRYPSRTGPLLDPHRDPPGSFVVCGFVGSV